MKKLSILMMAVALGAMATAQEAAKNITVRGGVSWPTGDPGKTIKKNGFSAGLTYGLKSQGYEGKMMDTAVYLDYHKVSGSGAHVTSWGLGYQASSTLGNGQGTMPLMGGFGLGYYNVSATGMNSGGVLGGKLFVSTALSQGLSLTTSYNLVGSKNGVKPSYFAVELGFKF